ncbi:hypothetical protein C8F04DRAFT_1230618 [Mycena alexandri]|uniref:Uncharacterized protein n=1 Tax=Mycena alexandri TaxID=1745969 RepID=A0AAD6T9G9_9AGAR|nr:hypothetical protein C8F04DRAFT_1230618 [Mycena alexandri]
MPPGLHYKTSKKRCPPTVDSPVGKSHQDWRTRPDLESNEGLAFQYYKENTVNVRVTSYATWPTTAKIPKSPRFSRKLTNRHDAYAEHGTVNIANAGYCTEYGKCRHAVHIKATEGGISFKRTGKHGDPRCEARRAVLKGVALPSVGPTKVKLDRSFNQGGSRVVVERAAKLPNGQQPNLAACNRWLGPRTQIRARSTTPIVAEGLSNSIITTPQFILTTSPHTRPRN